MKKVRKQVIEHNKKPKVYYDANGKKHTHGIRLGISSGHDGHHETHHHIRRWKRVLMAAMIVIMMLVIVVFAAWRVMDALGKGALYRNGKTELALAGDSAEDQAAAQASQNGEKWESGWIRYNGKVYEYNDNILTFLIMGIDNEYKVKTAADGISGGQADAQFLLILNPDTGKIMVIAINRNTMTSVDVYDKNGDFVATEKLQICLAHGYGDAKELSCERQVDAVSKLLYGLPINGYAAVNIGGISALNDAVGGVTVNVLEDTEILSGDNGGKMETLKKGDSVTLTGQEAYWYVRNRDDSEKASADDRLARQKQYITSFIKQMRTELVKNPAVILDLYKAISPYLVTDITTTELTYLAGQAGKYSFDSNGMLSIKGTTTPGEDGTETGHDEFTYDEAALYDLMINSFYKEVEQ